MLFAAVSLGMSRTLEIGAGKPFDNLRPAAQHAQPGDTLLFYAGIFSGGQAVSNLKGTALKNIVLTVKEDNSVIVRGGSSAWQLTDAEYLHVSGFIFEGQTGNGLNFDDGGDYSTPAHHIIFEDCIFRDIDATGNNDLLKLSGVDDFQIKNCTFENGSPGGSGIDMVGCHRGEILSCRFQNMGSNAVQAKGGSQFIRIQGNWFENCGQRAVNLGGSTGLPFFRPANAEFEAADLQVFSNVFIGTIAPIAFVGCVRTHVINNTIIDPEKWVVRILQENTDSRFLQCGDNSFQNNLIYQKTLWTETNVGGNTRPHTFSFRANYWFNFENSNWPGPQLPVDDPAQIINKNPLFKDRENQNLALSTSSPAIGLVQFENEPQHDFDGRPFHLPRSVGAFEGATASGLMRRNDIEKNSRCQIWPNPPHSGAVLFFHIQHSAHTTLKIYNLRGQLVHVLVDDFLPSGEYSQPLHNLHLSSGIYFYQLTNGTDRISGKMSLLKS
jgi:hypothetical protein